MFPPAPARILSRDKCYFSIEPHMIKSCGSGGLKVYFLNNISGFKKIGLIISL